MNKKTKETSCIRDKLSELIPDPNDLNPWDVTVPQSLIIKTLDKIKELERALLHLITETTQKSYQDPNVYWIAKVQKNGKLVKPSFGWEGFDLKAAQQALKEYSLEYPKTNFTLVQILLEEVQD
jgi:hypothetical protein